MEHDGWVDASANFPSKRRGDLVDLVDAGKQCWGDTGVGAVISTGASQQEGRGFDS